jgi:ribosome modulation factor
MSEQLVAELYDRLIAGKFKERRIEYPFQRGYNAGIDFAIKQMRLACDEPDERAMKDAAE